MTVMFCDLVGSTPLSTRFNPEGLRELIGVYHHAVAGTVLVGSIALSSGWVQSGDNTAAGRIRAGL